MKRTLLAGSLIFVSIIGLGLYSFGEEPKESGQPNKKMTRPDFINEDGSVVLAKLPKDMPERFREALKKADVDNDGIVSRKESDAWRQKNRASLNNRNFGPKPEVAKEVVPGKLLLQEAELPAVTDLRSNGPQNSQILDDTKKETVQYWIYLPTNESAKSSKGFPTILYLHGGGERGDNANLVKKYDPIKSLGEGKVSDCRFIMIAPQCKGNRFWVPGQLIKLLDMAEEKYPIDKSRVYITGMSLGGFGTWGTVLLAPERFAAAAPVCGRVDLNEVKKLVDFPHWIFHGDKDNVVPTKGSTDAEEALRQAGSKKVKMTIYKNVGHDSWLKAHTDPQLYEWFLSNTNNNAK